MNIYNVYIEQAKQYHSGKYKWVGKSLTPHIPEIESLLREKKLETILDYGCGKAETQPPEWSVTNYDPAVKKFSGRPEGTFDLVISTDVLEHVPEDYVDEVVQDIFSFSKHWVFLSISTREAHAILPNGMNAHATVKPPGWWEDKLFKYNNYSVVFGD